MYVNDNMTIYNKTYNPETRLTTWNRTQILGVFWVNCKGANKFKSGIDACDSVQVFVPLSVSGYVDPKQYAGESGTWTLQPGDKIVRGLIDQDFIKITDLEKLYSDAHDITSIDRKDYGSQSMRHWEIAGK